MEENTKTHRRRENRKLLSGDTVTIRVHISVYKMILEENQNLETISETLKRLLENQKK